MTMVTSPAWGMPAAPMLAAVAVMLQSEKGVQPWLLDQNARASGPAKAWGLSWVSRRGFPEKHVSAHSLWPMGSHPHSWGNWNKLGHCAVGQRRSDSAGLLAQLHPSLALGLGQNWVLGLAYKEAPSGFAP